MLNRTIQLNIRVTQEEKQRFEQAAKACGLSLSRYVRMRLSGEYPSPLRRWNTSRFSPGSPSFTSGRIPRRCRRNC